ncbi:MAG: hypothetical protein WC216_09465 [Gallionella sp.]|jgi:hypothetical protein
MATRIIRDVFDFLAKNYTTTTPEVNILPDGFNPSTVKAQPDHQDSFVQRWYLSLQGEETPLFSQTTLVQDNAKEQRIYRYDWAFGITVIEPFWWDWMAELCDDSSLAIHIALEPVGDSPEAIPVSATLSALHPSRNTRSVFEKISKAAAETARIGATALPLLDYVSSGLTLASNVLDSDTDGQKNWFLYQFFDEKLKCPAVEWRINKQVLREYGPLLRGSLFLAFHGSAESSPGRVRILLRPQIRYCDEGDINFVTPADKIEKEKQVYIEVTPQEAN